MKTFFSKFQTHNIKKTLFDTMKRFPLSIFLLFVISGLLIYGIITDFDIAYKEQLIKGILSCIMLFFFTVSVTLITETGKFSKIKIILFHILTLIFGIVFYTGFTQNIDDIENFIYFMLSIVGIISLLFYAGYSKYIFKKKMENPNYYHYFYSIASVLLLSSIVAGTLSILGVIGITAILTLFDIRIIDEAKVFAYWFVFANILFAPVFALTQIPKKKSFLDITPNNFFHFLIKYIATPFIYIYFFILYAYSLKVLLNFSEWPQGEVSWLVIGFSSFGYLIYIFSHIFEAKNTFIKTFRRLFPFVVLPQIGMLFYAIYLRISQYDITINRYFIVVFGVWLLGISLYYICSRKKYLLIIPTSLTLMSLVISIGPWSVFNLPITRQLDRLETHLEKAGILSLDTEKTIIPLTSENDISPELSKQIYGGIEYLCRLNHCMEIKNLFPKIYSEILEASKKQFEVQKQQDIELYASNSFTLEMAKKRQFKEPRSWEIIQEITSKLGVKNYFETSLDQEFIFISLDYSQNFFPINTAGYSKIHEIRGDREIQDTAQLNIETETIRLPDGVNYDVSNIIEELITLYNTPGLENPIKSPELLTFETNDFKLYIRNINLKNPQFTGEKAEFPYYAAQGYILIK